MSLERRTVRATLRFFQDLDRQLPSERGRNGEPSTNDFQVLDLLRIVDTFALEWDTFPELIHGRSQYRILLATGNVVPRFSVIGQLALDGAIELAQLDIDLDATW